ncbi:hypothetical protein EAI_16592, partial [Harpegnathos saltator]
SHLIQEFLTKHGIVQLRQPPYNPDIAPCDFWLKSKRFDNVEEIKRNATRELLTIRKNDFQDCFRKWVHHWQKVIASEGNYFESDVAHIQ